jgi:hypothetical protein
MVQWSVRTYKKLILAYPAEFRQKFENEMILVFKELVSDALRRHGLLGLLWAWCRVLGDLLRTVPQEHSIAFSRRILMKTSIRAFLWILLAAFIHYFVFLSIGILFMGSLFLFHGESWLMRTDRNSFAFLEIVIFLIPPFVTGMILARTKPFFRPYLTAPLAIMMIGLAISLGEVSSSWSVWRFLGGIGFTLLLSLESFLGCFVATKLSQRSPKPQAVQQETTQLT